MNPSILILDEPSAGLDPRARRTLIKLLRELPITMLISTHDMRMVQELFPLYASFGKNLASAPATRK